ncbi:hypothetical protein I5F35_30045, partial [Pseudomonas aeruginosa]|nr:hypothetical protein [Pseudomonas aeruginosa]
RPPPPPPRPAPGATPPSPRRRGARPRLLWRALTRFLPIGRAGLQARLRREEQLLRTALLREV